MVSMCLVWHVRFGSNVVQLWFSFLWPGIQWMSIGLELVHSSSLVQFVVAWWYVSQRWFIVGSDVAQLFVAVVAHILFILMWHYGQRWFSLVQLV